MKKFLLLCTLLVSPMFANHDIPEHNDDLIVYDYSRTWFLVNNGKFDEAKEEISEMPWACEEEVIHQELIKLYIAIRQKRHSECRQIMKIIDRFSSDVYSTN